MSGLPDAWLLAANALDHHDTAVVLAAALATILDDETGELGQRIAARQTAELGRAGFALVRLDGGESLTTDMIQQVDQALQERAATGWFGRSDD